MTSPPRERVRDLGSLTLERVRAHDGEGLIRFRRVFESGAFVGLCNFVDYAVLPPGTSIGLHRHGRDEEIYLVLEGEGTMTLDGEELRVHAGNVIVNRPDGQHGLRNDGDSDLRLFVVEIALPDGALPDGALPDGAAR